MNLRNILVLVGHVLKACESDAHVQIVCSELTYIYIYIHLVDQKYFSWCQKASWRITPKGADLVWQIDRVSQSSLGNEGGKDNTMQQLYQASDSHHQLKNKYFLFVIQAVCFFFVIDYQEMYFLLFICIIMLSSFCIMNFTYNNYIDISISYASTMLILVRVLLANMVLCIFVSYNV